VGPGTLQLNNKAVTPDTYSGGTILTNAAVLRFDQANDVGTGAITFGGATPATTTSAAWSLNNDIILSAGTANTLGQSATGTGGLSLSGPLTSATSAPGSWTTVGAAPASSGGQQSVTVMAGGSVQFYQLANPTAQ
jgi:hypothetical protein